MAKFIKFGDGCRYVRESALELILVQDLGDGTWQVVAYGASGMISDPIQVGFTTEEAACEFAEDFAKGLS